MGRLCATGLAWLLVIASAPALAAPAGTEDGVDGDPNKKICRTMPSTGWRTAATRVCRTRAEWKEWARQNNIDVRDILRRRSNTGS